MCCNILTIRDARVQNSGERRELDSKSLSVIDRSRITNIIIAINRAFFFFSSNKITFNLFFGNETIDFQRNIGNLQSMKERLLVKRNWRKTRIIFLQKVNI